MPDNLCTQCQTVIKEGDKFCSQCGWKIQVVAEMEEPITAGTVLRQQQPLVPQQAPPWTHQTTTGSQQPPTGTQQPPAVSSSGHEISTPPKGKLTESDQRTLFGCGIYAIGLFCPFISGPFGLANTYIQGHGQLVFCLLIVAAVAVVIRQRWLFWFASLAASVVFTVDLISILIMLDRSGLPAGIGWGVAVMLAGMGLMLLPQFCAQQAEIKANIEIAKHKLTPIWRFIVNHTWAVSALLASVFSVTAITTSGQRWYDCVVAGATIGFLYCLAALAAFSASKNKLWKGCVLPLMAFCLLGATAVIAGSVEKAFVGHEREQEAAEAQRQAEAQAAAAEAEAQKQAAAEAEAQKQAERQAEDRRIAEAEAERQAEARRVTAERERIQELSRLAKLRNSSNDRSQSLTAPINLGNASPNQTDSGEAALQELGRLAKQRHQEVTPDQQ